MRMMTNYLAVSVTEYNDGSNNTSAIRWDKASGRTIPEYLGPIYQHDSMPLSAEEMLVMAALEVIARALQDDR